MAPAPVKNRPAVPKPTATVLALVETIREALPRMSPKSRAWFEKLIERHQEEHKQ